MSGHAAALPESFVGGTRWRRSVAAAVLGLGVLAAGVVAVSQDVLAATVVYQGGTAEFSTGRISGQDVAFAMVPVTRTDPDGGARTTPVLRAGFATARMDGLCLSQVEQLPGIGPVTIRVEAGDGDPATQEITAADVQIDLLSFRGSGSGINLDGVVQIGLASSDVTTRPGAANPLGAPTEPGWTAIDASAGDIVEVRGLLADTTIGGPLTLPGLRITLVPGENGCSGTPVAG
ncbi:DUF6230 family protein [Klenkia sp. LSe6-5]|uniref:DUF6230 family protein n=1 Tax=Klenkia sesuvii TaxID=3103137 RepID=A0ABU8DU10_9ACTN